MKLAKREKYFVYLAGAAIGVFIIFQFFVFPFFDKRDRIKRGISVKEKGLQEILMLNHEYQAGKKGFQGIGEILLRRGKEFTLFSFLEKEAGKARIKSHIKYMKPSVSQGTEGYKESVVEMKLEGISLNQLVEYLYRIESLENLICIKRISIKENKKKAGYLDAVLQVLTFIRAV